MLYKNFYNFIFAFPIYLRLSWIGAAITGAVSLYSAKKRNDAQKDVASDTNAFNAEEAQKNRDWQEKMSNTAHQRQIEDLRKAGLNPILSAQYGGASTPAGSTASGVMPLIEDEWTPAINTGMQAYQAQANVGQTYANINKIEQEVKNLKSTQGLTEEQTRQVSNQILKIGAEIDKIKEESYGVALDVVVKEAITKYYMDNPHALLFKETGIHQTALSKILSEWFKVDFNKIKDAINKSYDGVTNPNNWGF